MTCDVTHPAIATKLIAAAMAETLKTLNFVIWHVLMFQRASEQLARGKAVNDLPVLAGVRGKDLGAEVITGRRHPGS